MRGWSDERMWLVSTASSSTVTSPRKILAALYPFYVPLCFPSMDDCTCSSARRHFDPAHACPLLPLLWYLCVDAVQRVLRAAESVGPKEAPQSAAHPKVPPFAVRDPTKKTEVEVVGTRRLGQARTLPFGSKRISHCSSRPHVASHPNGTGRTRSFPSSRIVAPFVWKITLMGSCCARCGVDTSFINVCFFFLGFLAIVLMGHGSLYRSVADDAQGGVSCLQNTD